MRALTLLLLAFVVSACASETEPPEASGESTDATTTEAHSEALTVLDAMTVAAPEGGTGGAFMTLVGGAEADTLVAARFAGAERVEVHETYETEDGLRGMQEVEGGIAIASGETVELRPGGFHVMLINLASPLAVGDTVDVELEMALAGTVPVRVAVRPVEDVRGEAPDA